jgi:hypothetical protein
VTKTQHSASGGGRLKLGYFSGASARWACFAGWSTLPDVEARVAQHLSLFERKIAALESEH